MRIVVDYRQCVVSTKDLFKLANVGDPLVIDIAELLKRDVEKHDEIAKEWTKKFAR